MNFLPVFVRRLTLAVCLLAVALSSSAFAQSLGVGRLLSPGDLAKSHAELDSIKRCTDCHDLQGGVNDTKCLDCHKELATLVSANKGYHARASVKEKKCQKCHPDHKGKAYYMILWDGGKRDSFNHDTTGYALKEKHRISDCEKCHNKKTAKGSVTYLGLSRECVSCHKDVHQKTLGEKCADCHVNFHSWKGLDVKFDHDKQAKYPLEGKHQRITCDKCHPKRAKDEALFKVAGFERCVTCHKKEDVHKNALGDRCENCHYADDWKRIKFNHDKARFRLKGKHGDVKCEKCHPGGAKAGFKVAKFDACGTTDCHDTEARGLVHGEQFKGRRCEECHNETTWKPSLFKHEDPAYKGYKLEAGHANVKCEKCHVKNTAGVVVFKPIDTRRCDTPACHDKPERGAIHGRQFEGVSCDQCHTAKNWKPATFSHESPSYRGFRLEGRHKDVKCEKCHKKDESTVPRYDDKSWPQVHYKPIGYDRCDTSACHPDPHKRLFVPRRCDECHVAADWKNMSAVFDHTLDTHFPLTGKHKTAKCDECHKNKTWKPVAMDCLACHKKDDKHKGKLGALCEECHTTATWSPKVAAHERTGFPLTETHAQMVCADCHTKGKGDFSGLSPDCQQCHTDPHLNQMGRLCNDCHTMRNWEPMKFKHNLTGFRLEGAHKYQPCGNCHQGRVYRVIPGDCYNCHVKDFISSSAVAFHKVFNPSMDPNCAGCHTQFTWSLPRR